MEKAYTSINSFVPTIFQGSSLHVTQGYIKLSVHISVYLKLFQRKVFLKKILNVILKEFQSTNRIPSAQERKGHVKRIAKHISIPIYQLEHRYTCFRKILSKFQGLVLFHLLHHIPHFSVTSFSISTTFSKTDSCDSRVSKSPIFRYYLTGLPQTDQNLFSACSEECLDANMTVLTTHPPVSEAFTQNELLKLNNIRLLYK